MATITSPRAGSPASVTPRIKSPGFADTPTSSTRGSFELPSSRNASVSSNVAAITTSAPAGAGGPSSQAPRRGNRAALRDYYNLKSKPSQQQQLPGNLSRTASITSTTSELSTAPSVNTLTDNSPNNGTSTLTAQLDNQDFDPDGYISELLSTSSLRDILRVEATLVSEIRNLDGERKALVYDNYSKLIKAVGTIGEMQRSMNAAGGGLSEVGELEGRMENLRGMAVELGKPAEHIELKNRKERRQRKEEAIQRKIRIDAVQRVLAAPERLKFLMEHEREEDAEKEWAFVQQTLDKWKDVKGASDVRAQCEAIMSSSSGEEEAEEGKEKP